MLHQNRAVASASPTDPATACWPPVERNNVLLRFGLCCAHHTTTPEAQAAMLYEVGDLIGVTKDRLRAIQNEALMKLPGLFAKPS
jgi:DNA-directed RNA polymerase sigma subunit (sigma70/sigma32)